MKTEARIQQECVMWFWNSHPKHRGLLFEVNNNSNIPISWVKKALYALAKNALLLKSLLIELYTEVRKDGSKHKALGRVKGVSDLLFLIPGGCACGIEIKTETGVQSKSQKDWETLLNNNGHCYLIIYSLDEFKNLVNRYL